MLPFGLASTSAFGELKPRSPDNTDPGPRSWLGSLIVGSRDASGLLYRRNRYLDPKTGRFTQEDPIGLAGGLNAYGFANGDPVLYSDPYGLAACPGIPGTNQLDISDCPPGYLTVLLTVVGGGGGAVGGAFFGGAVCSPTVGGALFCAAGGAAAGASFGAKAGLFIGSALETGMFLSKALDGGGQGGADDGGLGDWARSHRLNASSPTTQNLFNNRGMSVNDFIGRFRKGSIREVFPSEFLDQTVEEALRTGGSTVRKLLTDSRFMR